MTSNNLQLFSVGGALTVVSTQLFLHFSQWSRFLPIVWSLFLLTVWRSCAKFTEASHISLKSVFAGKITENAILPLTNYASYWDKVSTMKQWRESEIFPFNSKSEQPVCWHREVEHMTSKRPYSVRLLITGLKTWFIGDNVKPR